MDDLKSLIEMLAHLPSMALWVIAGFWAYKVIVIGSLYGVIRFAVDKWFAWATAKKTQVVEIETRLLIDGLVISGSKEALLGQLHRIRNTRKSTTFASTYIHDNDVQWLREAIDDKFSKEQAKEQA